MAATCPHCNQEIKPTLSIEEYNRRFLVREEAFKALERSPEFNTPAWKYSPAGAQWDRLMAEAHADEYAAGI